MTREHECSSKNIAKITNSRSRVNVYIVLHLKWEAVVIENFGTSFTHSAKNEQPVAMFVNNIL